MKTVNDRDVCQLLNRAVAALEGSAELDAQETTALIAEVKQFTSQTRQASTVVVDMTCGEFHGAYSNEPINIIIISHDDDDLAAVNYVRKGMEGDDVYVVGHPSHIAPNVVAHYLNESKKTPRLAEMAEKVHDSRAAPAA